MLEKSILVLELIVHIAGQLNVKFGIKSLLLFVHKKHILGDITLVVYLVKLAMCM